MKIDGKYKPFRGVELLKRNWPNNVISQPPIWCSVDLRDGNQALVNPMSIHQKIEFFDLLVRLGFKEIEIGFPSSNETEFAFVRKLIEEKRIPDDVTIQVLCQARENLVLKTLEAVRGAKNVIFHIYNAISPAQRKYNFAKSKEEILQLAVNGVKFLNKHKKIVENSGTNIRFEYSPENFSQTEIDYSIQVCQAVAETWGATENNKIILNLPSTVECCLPNQFADLIEYFCTHIQNRNAAIISLHNHNDRGEGVAACEMGLLAGAERVEGCLFGNGERTGNLDIVNVALNMYSQGVSPKLDFSNIPYIREMYETLTGMQVYPRTPYAGELVYTAFSGSHQDAIRKAFSAREKMQENSTWDVPYLAIDPHDIGREYEGIIRFNSQSGKGGAAFILETEYGILAPKAMHPFIGEVVKKYADKLQRELKSQEIYDVFAETWLHTKSPLNVLEITEKHVEGERGVEGTGLVNAIATITWNETKYVVDASGNGPLDAFVNGIRKTPVPNFNITSFHEHSVGSGSDTQAMAYVQITYDDGSVFWGAGKSSNVGRAGIAAVVSALNFSQK